MAQAFDLHVYYYSDPAKQNSIDHGFGKKVTWDIPLLDGYDHSFLKNYKKTRSLNNKFFDVFNPAVFGKIRKRKAVVIINGWSYSSNIMAVIAAKFFGRKIWLRAENPLNQELKKRKTVLFLKKIILKYLLFPRVNNFLYIGQQNKAFFAFYGVPERKLIYTPYSVDNDFFKQEAEKYKCKTGEQRKEMNIPQDALVFLFSGKYIQKKRPMDLLKAFEKIKDQNVFLIMMGEGELRSEMEKFIADNDIKNALLTGFVNQSMVSLYYALADVFVMCSGSGETWGLSVNEAMNFSKPVIVSSTSGCSSDLVKNGENGFVFEEGDIASLAVYLQFIIHNPEWRKKAEALSEIIIRDYSIDNIVANLSMAYSS